jgi:predicted porin
MKKPLVLAIAAMALTSGVQAESKFYGKMNVSLGYDDVSEKMNVESNASRLGLKGSEDLGSGTKVIYQAEYQTDIDGDGNDFEVLKQRDSYVGLSYDGMGTVKMGVMDTPLKKSQGKFDLFNDVYDMKIALDGEKRLGNSLNYTTEKFGALQGSVSLVMMEDGSDDGISANLVYKEGDIYAAVAMDHKTEDADTATVRGTVVYSMGDMRFGALVNSVDASDTADAELGLGVNASLKMGVNTAKVQFLSSDQGGLGEGGTLLTFGVDHKLAKSTKAYAYVALADADTAASDVTSMAFGLEHKF